MIPSPAFPMKSVVLVDLANIGHASAANQTKLSAGDLDTTAIYGVVQTLRRIAADYPGQMTCLHEGRAWRHAELACYKEGREATPEAIALRSCWKVAKPYVARLLPHLGVNQLLAPNLEADDLAAKLRTLYVKKGYAVTLVSGDRDWRQLVGPNVQLINPISAPRGQKPNVVRLTEANFQEVTGFQTPFALAERKALMGKVQEMPGVGGIGEKTAEVLLNTYGSVRSLVIQAETDKTFYEALDGRIKKLVDDPERLARYESNLKLAWLDHPEVPAAATPKAVKGVFNKDAFLDLAAELSFFSITRAIDQWMQPFTDKE